MKRLSLFIVVVLLFLGVTTPSIATPPQGPVTIVTDIDLSEFPFVGTFAVVEGAGLLGCTSGTFIDLPGGIVPGARGNITKNFTCTEGGIGTFVANFQLASDVGPGDLNGHWNITDAAGAFAGLRGEGDFSVDTDCCPLSGVETLTGSIHFNP
jgi:hypothetical protein